MDLQLDAEIRSVLKLVRSSLRTNGTPLKYSVRELKRVTESVQNEKYCHRPKRPLDEKIEEDSPEEKHHFRLEDMEMKQQLANNTKYLKDLKTNSKKRRKRKTKFRGIKIPKQPQQPAIRTRKTLKHRSSSKRNSIGKERQSTRLERTKRQLEKENVSALYEASRLRQELRKEKRALAKERSENARKSLEIDLLRNENRTAHENLSDSQTALKEAQKRCQELETSLRPQNEATHAAQDQYTGGSPITVDGSSFDEAGDLYDMTPSKPSDPDESENRSSEYERQIATPPPSQKRLSSVRTAATPPETPMARPSNNAALLADYFPVVEDENFDVEMEEVLLGHLEVDRVFRRFKEFLKIGHENSWYCVQDIAKYGYSFGSWNDSICENGEHDGVRCRQVEVTEVDSIRRLCFKRDKRESVNPWQGGWNVDEPEDF
ncbi:hypothetical protein FGADI_3876 [Fusarium gaditjirri]|uniref:Uncharacterized protein n=1 Tax=Fusarium gaditjirri TaxID=282569 RepID=A0A8H4X0A0_9HYPO|nr:hypothetical protein FGADI_3876 [Fusarium gaditjirri]